MSRPYRYAVYFAPSPGTDWAEAGAAWLGRCADGGGPREQPALPGWSADEFAQATAEPRRYGWHATLKAPFRLAEGRGEEELRAAVAALAASVEPFDLPPLEPAWMGDFLALKPAAECAGLRALERRCVVELAPFAAPAPAPEIERRRCAGLSARQDELLLRWGYPFVLEEHRFHLTLTGRLGSESPQRRAALLDAALAFFGRAQQPLRVLEISIFAEPEAGAAFTRIACAPLR